MRCDTCTKDVYALIRVMLDLKDEITTHRHDAKLTDDELIRTRALFFKGEQCCNCMKGGE